MKDVLNDLQHIVNEVKAASVVVVSSNASFEIENVSVLHCPAPDSFEALAEIGQHAVGIVLLGTDHLDKRAALQIISRMKTLHCKHLLVATQHPDWEHTDFYALGMTHLNHYENGVDLYEFNIHSYKSVPDWLNNKFWANPKMWDKYHW